MSVSVLSVNARGTRDQLKRTFLFLFFQNKGADFYFIQETHATKSDISFWKSQWGKNIWFSFGSNRSAGVAILQGNFKGHIIKHLADSNGRWVILVVDVDHSQFIIINIYACNNKKDNKLLFTTIENKINQLITTFPTAKIIWGGDFNTVMDGNLDRWPPRNSSSDELENVCQRMSLVDIWRHKNPNNSILYILGVIKIGHSSPV